jgi:hypothetical protein
MCREQFDQIEAEAVGAFCGICMGAADMGETGFVERLRDRPMAVERHRQRRQGRPGTGVGVDRPAAVPRNLCRAFAPGMRELDAERGRTGAAAECDDRGERRLICIRIEAETALTDAPSRLDCGLLDDNEASARQTTRSRDACRCQSFANPSAALYWHIGDTAIRFAKVTPPRVIGSNRRLVGFIGMLSIAS